MVIIITTINPRHATTANAIHSEHLELLFSNNDLGCSKFVIVQRIRRLRRRACFIVLRL